MHSEGLFFIVFVGIDERGIEANDLVSYDANFPRALQRRLLLHGCKLRLLTRQKIIIQNSRRSQTRPRVDAFCIWGIVYCAIAMHISLVPCAVAVHSSVSVE
jgi:hypothetical protein